MKNILVTVFLLVSFSAFAQQNEISFSFQPFSHHIESNESDFGNIRFSGSPGISSHAVYFVGRGVSLSYYRNVSTNSAFGIHTNFNSNQDGLKFKTADGISGSIDLVNRWRISKGEKIRLLGEVGISAMRQFQQEYNCFYCYSYYDPSLLPSSQTTAITYWTKTNFFGITSRIGFDFQLSKNIILGSGFDFKMYFFNDSNINEMGLLPTWNIDLGYKF